MVSYTVTVLTLAAAAAAQATYGSAQNQTQVDCYIKYNSCRTTRDPATGASANQAACAAEYAGCLGFSPFNSDGTNTVTPSYSLPAVSRTSSATTAPSASAVGCVDQYNKCRQPTNGVSANQAFCAAQNAECKGNCDKAYDTCRTTRVDGLSANQAACAAAYAGCLGENPFVASSSMGNSYTTKVVTAYTTVCPGPTTFTHGPSTYTVTSATTLTLPCPGGCTITTPVAPPATTPAAPPATTPVAPPATTPVYTPGTTGAPVPLTTVTRPTNNVGVPTPTSTRAVYTGAAVKVGGSGALIVGALGLLAL